MSNAVVENVDYQENLTAQALQKLITEKEVTIREMMPRGVDQGRLVKLVFSAYRSTPKLAQCSPLSVLNSVFTAAQMGLEFNTLSGHGWLVPRWNGRDRRTDCQFQPGYRGLVELAYRSGKVTTINSALVHENDEFEYEEGTNGFIKHKRCLKGDRGPWYAAYAIIHPSQGPPFTHIMRRDEIMEIRDKCAPRNKKGELVGPWVDWEEAMALKTCLKPPLKLAPCSVELSRAIGLDDELDALHAPPAVISVSDFEGIEGVDPARLLEGGDAPVEGSKEEQDAVRAEKLKAAKAHFKGLSDDQRTDFYGHADSLYGAQSAAKISDALKACGYETIFDVPATGLAGLTKALEGKKK